MDLKKQRHILFYSFLILFIFTAGMALIGICISWTHPKTSLPHLEKLIAITIGEVCAGVILLFYRTFGLGKKMQSGTSAEMIYVSIKDCFSLFKGCLTSCSDIEINFRLHFLSYDIQENKLSMKVQDDMYEDSHFEYNIEDGCEKEIVVCKALKKGGLIIEKLKKDHYIKYPNTPIRKKLKEVMAFPVNSPHGGIAGVIALDSDEEFKNIGIAPDKLEKLFLKLSKMVEDLLSRESTVNDKHGSNETAG